MTTLDHTRRRFRSLVAARLLARKRPRACPISGSLNPQPPVACTLNQQDLKQRAERWQALARRAGGHVARTDRGLRLTSSAGPGVAAELEELAELERDCCAFASWSVSSAGDLIVLDVAADGEVAVAAVQAMFDSLLATG